MTAIKSILFSTLFLLSGAVWAQDKTENTSGAHSGFFYSFAYTPVYQLKTDIGKNGSFSAHRHYLSFDIMTPISEKLYMGLGLNYDIEYYNFNNIPRVADATP